MMIEDALSSSSLEDLLHQALVQGDQNAWVGIQQCLSETVRSWLHAHPSKEAALSFVSEEYYVALTFERLRRAAIKRQMTCETLSRVLVYLRASLNGAILEMLRVSSRPRVVSERMAGERSLRGHPESLEVWDRLRALLSNEREQRLAYLLYHCGLSPAEIVLRCPQEWSDVQEIHRLRHTILERLLHNANQLTLTAQTRRGDATRG